jgi:opacity protein-like surface antigen
MRRLAFAFLSTSALVGFGQTASAADMRAPAPVYKAAPAAVVPYYNWTGWYAGGNIGYSWGRTKSDFGLAESIHQHWGPGGRDACYSRLCRFGFGEAERRHRRRAAWL